MKNGPDGVSAARVAIDAAPCPPPRPRAAVPAEVPTPAGAAAPVLPRFSTQGQAADFNPVAATIVGTPPRPPASGPAVEPPNRLVLRPDLGRIRGVAEDQLLGPDGSARLYAVASGPRHYHPEREPLMLVHGIHDDPASMQAIVDRFRDNPRYQLYVLCYDDNDRRTTQSGHDFGDQLRDLQQRLGASRDMTIVAHSMGGLVSRQALNDLTQERQIGDFGQVRLMTADTPWYGSLASPPGGPDGPIGRLVFRGLGQGAADMPYDSRMFQGDPQSQTAGIYDVMLPGNVHIDAVFASETGRVTQDFNSGPLAALPGRLVALYRHDTSVRGDPRMVNQWHAMLATDQFLAFDTEMEQLALRGELDEATARDCLNRHWPRMPGDHAGILQDQPGHDFLDYLQERLQ